MWGNPELGVLLQYARFGGSVRRPRAAIIGGSQL